jgi:hypothetical protein
MKRYGCQSRLMVSLKTKENNQTLVTIRLEHHERHVPYYDVALPPEAADIIRNNLEHSTPVAMVGRVQTRFPKVTAKQIHAAWTVMSEILWKRDKDQLKSAKVLVEEYADDVDYFEMEEVEGIEQFCWGMKKIAQPLTGKVVEVGIDATCKLHLHHDDRELTMLIPVNTNAKHLELYAVMAEHDGAGFPIAYCLLSTANSIEIGKRTKALKAWAIRLKEKYGINPKFAHVDKDMGEIAMLRIVWDPKIGICYWHHRKAVSERLAKAKLSTSPYDPDRAHAEFPSIISPAFRPKGRPDKDEYEGGIRDDVADNVTHQPGPNSLYIRLAIPSTCQSPPTTSTTPSTERSALGNVSNVHESRPTTSTIQPPPVPPVDRSNVQSNPRPTIRIPPRKDAENHSNTAVMDKDSPGPEEEDASRRTFCPIEHRETIIQMMERHYCAHPLIPGYSAPTPAGIRVGSKGDIYVLC